MMTLTLYGQYSELHDRIWVCVQLTSCYNRSTDMLYRSSLHGIFLNREATRSAELTLGVVVLEPHSGMVERFWNRDTTRNVGLHG